MGTLQVGEFPEIMNYNLVDYIAIKLLFKKKIVGRQGHTCVSTPHPGSTWEPPPRRAWAAQHG